MHYKRNKRRVLALFVLVAAVAMSVFILTPNRKEKDVFVINPTKNNNPSLQFESGATYLLGVSAIETKPRNSEEETDNLTELLIKSYERRVSENEGSLLSDEDLSANIQESIARGLNVPWLTSEDVITSNDNSEAGQVAYTEFVDDALYKNFKEFEGETAITALQKFLEENNPDLLNYLIKAIPSHIDDLLILEVPSLWASAHLQMLNIWQEKLAIYQAVVDMQSDPLKTYVALQQFTDVVQKDLDLQIILIQKYEELTQN